MRVAGVVSLLLVVLGLVAWILRQRSDAKRADQPRRPPKFRVGQVWTYKTREKEAASRVTIVRLDRFGQRNAVHIFVSNVSIQNSGSPSGVSTFISHMPFSETALQQSVMQRVGAATRLPEFEDAYNAWKRKANARKAGIFTIEVAEAIEGIERAFAGSKGQPRTPRFSNQRGR